MASELEVLVGFAQNYMAGRRAGFTETANDSRDAERLIERLANYKATPPADAALADADIPPHYTNSEAAAFECGYQKALRARPQAVVAQVPAGIWMREFVDAVEREAFDMRAPNTHTPVLVGMCIEARRRLLAASQSATGGA